VDRLWPRGISKARASVDLWLKDIAPSGELRKWFGHDPERWPEFKKRYAAELKGKKELVDQIVARARAGRVTLVFGAKDETRNQAVVLQTFVARRR